MTSSTADAADARRAPPGGGVLAVGAIVAIGELVRTEGLALAGAELFPAEGPEDMRVAWAALGDEVSVVILTRTAADAVRGLDAPARRLRVVIPE